VLPQHELGGEGRGEIPFWIPWEEGRSSGLFKALLEKNAMEFIDHIFQNRQI